MKDEKLIETKDGIKLYVKKTIRKFGDGSHVYFPKKYIGKEAEIYILIDIEKNEN